MAVAMFSTRWRETLSGADQFQYDGEFVANPQMLGRWEVIHAVSRLE